MSDDEKWMSLALKQAVKAEKEGEVPVGAVLVKDDLLIAKAHNQPISKHDATAHAEIQLIRTAGKKQENYRLTGTSPSSSAFIACSIARLIHFSSSLIKYYYLYVVFLRFVKFTRTNHLSVPF